MHWELIILVAAVVIGQAVRDIKAGNHIATLYRLSPKAAFLNIAFRWLVSQPTADATVVVNLWPDIEARLGQPGMVEIYRRLVEQEAGWLNGDSLVRACTNLFCGEILPTDVAEMFDRCLVRTEGRTREGIIKNNAGSHRDSDGNRAA